MEKLCECGCGHPAPLAAANHTARGIVKGQPLRFVAGHQNRDRKWSGVQRQRLAQAKRGHAVSNETREKIASTHRAKGIRPSREALAKGNANMPRREASASWKGGTTRVNGRMCLYRPDHPRAHHNGYVYEHIIVAEVKIGRPVEPWEVVHHIDGDDQNNLPGNLDVLPSQADHIRLHKEQGDLR